METEISNPLNELVLKIKRLRNKLTSYGWNKQESNHFILFEVLKLPRPTRPHLAKEHFQHHPHPAHSYLVASLEYLVPNLQEQDVL